MSKPRNTERVEKARAGLSVSVALRLLACRQARSCSWKGALVLCPAFTQVNPAVNSRQSSFQDRGLGSPNFLWNNYKSPRVFLSFGFFTTMALSGP